MDFDAHAHLPEGDACPVPATWRGVVCAVRESEFERLNKLAEENVGVIPAFGLHPWFIRERSEKWLETLRRFLEKTPRAQVGEIGLDNVRTENASLEEQKAIFIAQLRLAAEFNVPANLHCVRAWNAMTCLLRAEKRLPKLHFHAFSGSAEIARELMKLADTTFSFSPRQTQCPSEKLRRALETIPPDRLFEESDDAIKPF